MLIAPSLSVRPSPDGEQTDRSPFKVVHSGLMIRVAWDRRAASYNFSFSAFGR